MLGDAQVGKNNLAFIVDPRGQVLATSAKGPEVGKDVSTLPQVAAMMAKERVPAESGADVDGHSMLTAAAVVPKLGWSVFFEQPTSTALAPIRDQLVRIALLVGLGLIIAILAGSVMARRMLVPINALRAGARRLGSRRFQPAHRGQQQ